MVVNTVRSVFPHVSVWNHRHQGFVVASNEPLAVDLVPCARTWRGRACRPYLRELRSGSPLELLGDLVVTDGDADRFLDGMAELLFASRGLVSTDVWPALEYETPKDILSNFLYFQNRAIFRRFRSRALPLPRRAVPGRALARGGGLPPRLVRPPRARADGGVLGARRASHGWRAAGCSMS